VDYGIIKLFATSNGGGQTTASGDNVDDLTFTDPLVAKGTMLGVNFDVSVNGTVVGGPGSSFLGTACWQLNVSAGSTGVVKQACASDGVYIHSADGSPGDPFGSYLIHADVQSGVASEFDLILTISASTLHGGTATADLAHSFYWGGIQSVTLSGAPVSYTLTSASGTDWTRSFIPATAAPEPAGGLVVAVLLAGMWLFRRIARERAAASGVGVAFSTASGIPRRIPR
jgi:hypothetical protein